MFEDLVVMQQIPDDTWVCRLEVGNKVFLVQEDCFAIIEEVYFSGQIKFTFLVDNNWKHQSLIIKKDGKSLIGKQLLLPVENSLKSVQIKTIKPDLSRPQRRFQDEILRKKLGNK